MQDTNSQNKIQDVKSEPPAASSAALPVVLPDDPATLREQVQKSIVDIISRNLEAGVMSEERAKEIAKYILDTLPEGTSYEKLIEIIPKLDDNFVELSAAVIPLMVEYEKKMKAVVDGQISGLLKEGKFDDALKIASQAIEQEKKLS